MITLADAQRLADAALDAAADRGLARLSVVVTDAGGNIRAALRTDAQGAYGVDIALAKARSALGFRMSTRRLAQHFGDQAASTIGIAGATGGRFMPIGGGVVATDRAGSIVGAAAVAGGAPDVDDAVIRAAIERIGLEALP